MKKRILSSLLSASILISSVATQSITSFAADTKITLGDGPIQVVLASEPATFDVPVILSGNPGIGKVGIWVSYNDAIFELTEVPVDAGVLTNAMPAFSQTVNVNPFKIAWAHMSQSNGNGTLTTFKFKLKPDVQAGEYEIKAEFETPPADQNKTPVETDLISATINVIEHKEAKSVVYKGGDFVVAGDSLELDAVANDGVAGAGTDLPDKAITWALKAATTGVSIDGSTLKTTAATIAKSVEVIPTVVDGGSVHGTNYVGDAIPIDIFVPVTGISVTHPDILPGDTIDLDDYVTFTPADPSVADIAWSGDSVSADGTFSASTHGTFMVTATVAGGKRPAIDEDPAEDFVQENIAIEVTEPVRITAPSAPQKLKAFSGDTEVSISWAAPASTGGDTITGYEVSCSANGDKWYTTKNTYYRFTGLQNDKSYRFTVRAVNSVGAGDSVFVDATPVAPETSTGTGSGSTGGYYYSGGGGGGSTGGSTSGGTTGGTTKSVNSATAQKSMNAAIKNAGESGRGSAKFANVTNITKDAALAMAKAAKDADTDVNLIFDSRTKDNKVDVRITLDAGSLTNAVNVYGSTNDTNVQRVKAKFERFYSNVLQVVNLGQRGSFGQDAKIAFKTDITDIEGLAVYLYDPTTNKCTRLDTEIKLDKNGFLHISVPAGGQIILTDGTIAKK